MKPEPPACRSANVWPVATTSRSSRSTPAKRKDDAERARLLNAVDLAVLCLPDDAARAAVAMIENPNVRVLDASTAHRVQPGWAYGFPEMTAEQPALIAESRRISNPGCWATGTIALARPLVDAGMLPSSYPLTVGGVSGYSGGGKSLIDAFEGRGPDATTDAIRMYALNLQHKHLPEMRVYGNLARPPMFTPSAGRFRQGMLLQIGLYTDLLNGKTTGADVHTVLAERYAGQRFISVRPFAPGVLAHLEPEALNNTNQMELFVFENPANAQILLMARFDNLGKGASGAAAQNIDLMLGPRRQRPRLFPGDLRIPRIVPITYWGKNLTF